jgi:predicted metal-dependent enzyme (double-stranded beta helix superfamily)
MTTVTRQAAIDALFADTRRMLAGVGMTEEGLAVLGERLDQVAAVVYDRGDEQDNSWASAGGPSRELRSDPDGLSLIQVRFTAPREANSIHEHRAWWVLRVINGQEYYTEWDRLDDGSREGYAELRPGERRLIGPGDVLIATGPVIHCHEDYQGQAVDQLMLVGENPGRNPFRRFDPEAKTTFVSPPRNYAK